MQEIAEVGIGLYEFVDEFEPGSLFLLVKIIHILNDYNHQI
jgi:hypothetical protein